jgi:predicted signal transduction protein with EAL and GGDEF domain
VARLGGDEFTVLLPGLHHVDDARAVTDKIVSAFRRPFTLDGTQVFVTISGGVAVFPDHGDSVDSVVKKADAAMYRAKARGRDRVEVYGPEMEHAASARVALETDLHAAVGLAQMRTDYQPIVELASGRMVGVEALVRWEHPELGLLGPDQFIPLAEETGLVVGIDRWVLAEACRAGVAWSEQGAPLRVAVNLSAYHFTSDEVVAAVAMALDSSGLPAESLELEITESMAVHEAGDASILLRELSGLGVRIAIDDFGTGYSMLSSLRRFPLQRVKIDRSFVAGIGAQPDDGPIVAAMIDMAHSLGLSVTAEGVETVLQLDFLRQRGCDEVQGYLLGRPVPASALPRAGVLLAPAG